MIDYDLIKKIVLTDLERIDLSAPLRFNETIPYFKRLIESFLFFEGKEGELMTTDQDTIRRVFNEFRNLVQQVQNFQSEPSESVQNTQNRRNGLTDSIKNLDTTFTTNVLPIYLRIKTESSDKNFKTRIESFDKIIVEAQNLISTKAASFDSNFNSLVKNFEKDSGKITSDLQEQIKNSGELLRDAHEIKRKAEEFSTENIVEKYGSIFSNQAKENRVIAFISLALFLAGLVLTIIFAFRFFTPILNTLANIKDDETIRLEYIITNVIFRITLLSLFLVFVKECLKNFNINMRLYNINKHRQNSLESFRTLISNLKDNDSADREARSSIIRQIAETIYSNQDDGYISKDKKQMSVSEITDLVKALRGL